MDTLARVFFHVDARQAHLFGLPVVRYLHVTVFGDRQFVHADLIAFGQVGVEIILAGPAAGRRNRAVRGEGGPEREFYDLLVEDRQHAGQSQTHRAGMPIGVGTEARRTTAEDFRLGQKLGVHFQADDGFVLHGRTLVEPLLLRPTRRWESLQFEIPRLISCFAGPSPQPSPKGRGGFASYSLL